MDGTPDLSKRKQDIRGAAEAPTIYANYLGLLATKGDVCLRFGQIDEATTEKLGVDIVTKVYVSPDHYLDFIALMISKIPQYSDMFPDTAWQRLADHVQAVVEDAKAKAE